MGNRIHRFASAALLAAVRLEPCILTVMSVRYRSIAKSN